jgi:hypothetical protein
LKLFKITEISWLNVAIENIDIKEKGKTDIFVIELNAKFKVVKNQATIAEYNFEIFMSKLKKDIAGKAQFVL